MTKRFLVMFALVPLTVSVAAITFSTKATAESNTKTADPSLEKTTIGKYKTVATGDAYQVKSWATQWEFNFGKKRDKIWIVFSREETSASGIGWAYRTPEAVNAMIDMLEKAKASKQEVWYWYDAQKDALIVNGGKVPMVPPE